jgi:hypothetical protein
MNNEENGEISNVFYESFENRSKKEFIEKIITDIEEINQSLNKIFDNLSVETQELIAKINNTKAKLNQLINDKEFHTQVEKEILSGLQGHLKELQPKLKQLPYSSQPFINNVCKVINTLLEKLADFLMNGPIVSEGVYIAIPLQPHPFNFFHPARSINTSVEDLSKDLNPFSTSP